MQAACTPAIFWARRECIISRSQRKFLRCAPRQFQIESKGSVPHIEGMIADELKKLLRDSVFRPFTVHAEGKDFLISHPEFAALSPRGDTLIIFHRDDGAFEIVDVALIARARSS